jgi:hypothetical protein
VLSQAQTMNDAAFVTPGMQGMDRFVFEAGELLANHQFAHAAFARTFDRAPSLLAGLTTFNGADADAAGIARFTAAGFGVKVKEDVTPNAETGHAVAPPSVFVRRADALFAKGQILPPRPIANHDLQACAAPLAAALHDMRARRHCWFIPPSTTFCREGGSIRTSPTRRP